MKSEEFLLKKLQRFVEFQLGWGEGHTWSNRDFIELTERVFDKTKVKLSPSTLKRVWGRVNYDSKPSTTTLDTLSKFSGYENWRDFKLRSASAKDDRRLEVEDEIPATVIEGNFRRKQALIWGMIVLTVGVIFYSAWAYKRIAIYPDEYQFSSKTVVTAGIPNSVIFDLDASASPYDSVIIQQSWNSELQTKVPKDQKQHTSIYYYPNSFAAKLIVGDQVVKEHNLLIRSNGWMAAIRQKPAPVYFSLTEVKNAGKLEIKSSQVRSKNVKQEPVPAAVMFANVGDFGEIYSDNFVFETSVKNTYTEGAGACQNSTIFLYCIGTVIKVPLCSKGCISDTDIIFTDYYSEGKKEDLSAFGVDFSDFVKLKIESAEGWARIFINDKLSYSINKNIKKAKIVGISCRFAGAGAIDFVTMSNGKVVYRDDF